MNLDNSTPELKYLVSDKSLLVCLEHWPLPNLIRRNKPTHLTHSTPTGIFSSIPENIYSPVIFSDTLNIEPKLIIIKKFSQFKNMILKKLSTQKFVYIQYLWRKLKPLHGRPIKTRLNQSFGRAWKTWLGRCLGTMFSRVFSLRCSWAPAEGSWIFQDALRGHKYDVLSTRSSWLACPPAGTYLLFLSSLITGPRSTKHCTSLFSSKGWNRPTRMSRVKDPHETLIT